MRIGIMGGTFNPIHYGHLVSASEVCSKFKLDKVIFVPSSINPLKNTSNLVGAHHRLKMIKLAIADNPRFEDSDIEIKRGGASYTIDTIKTFVKKYGKDVNIYFIIGTDAFLEINSWASPDALLRMCKFIVTTRPGYDIKEAKLVFKKYIEIMKITYLKISSSDIRERIKSGTPIRYLLPKKVEDYIQKHELYK
ncbi:MAG: nicotinate-nucleotide adenylyltransferase [bacterium]|nr:nicotinate-nucleotide adenylyltransferase [bacterium]